MYSAASTDVTGEPIMTSGSIVDPLLGVPPSVNPALTDPNTGQLLPIAVPTPPPNPAIPLIITGVGLFLIYYFTRKK